MLLVNAKLLPVSDLAPSAGIVYSHNLWSKAPSSGSGTGDVIDNPKLAKTGSTSAGQLTAGWFKLLADSPAIDKAQIINEVSDDFLGKARGSSPDIGALEYVSGSQTTPSPTGIETPTGTPTSALSPASCSRKAEGDANCDLKVNGIDYSLWLNTQCRRTTTQSCATTRADFNADGNTDDDDYNIWFGKRGT